MIPIIITVFLISISIAVGLIVAPERTRKERPDTERIPPDMVRVEVGRSTEVWTLPKDLLSSASRFFRARLSNPRTKIIELPDTEAEVFASWIEFIYGEGHQSQNDGNVFWTLLVKQWLLSDRLGAPDFQLAISRQLIAQQEPPTMEAIKLAYANTDSLSPLRQILADICSQTKGASDDRWQWPKQFWYDYCASLEEWKENLHGIRETPSVPWLTWKLNDGGYRLLTREHGEQDETLA